MPFEDNPLWNETATFRQPGARMVAPAAPAPFRAAPPTPDATRGEGTLTKYRPVGGWQTPAAPGANLVAGRLEAGEPLTAFRGGAGAPTPTGVIRGMRQTFATDTGGPQPQEFASPQEAGQASNRFQRGAFLVANPADPRVTDPRGTPEEQANAKFGRPMVPGQTLAETPAREIPGHAKAWEAQAGLFEEQRKGVEATNLKTKIAESQATLRKQLEEEIGIPDAAGKNLSLPTDPNLQGIHKKMDRLALQGVSPEEAYKAVAPELHKHFYTPENVYGAIGLMEKQTGRPLPPELRQQLMAGSPEAMATLYPFTRKAATQPRGVISRTFNPAPTPGATAAPGSNLASETGFVAP